MNPTLNSTSSLFKKIYNKVKRKISSALLQLTVHFFDPSKMNSNEI